MNIEMLPLEIIGLKEYLQSALHTLRDLGCVHIDELSNISDVSTRPLALDRETISLQEEMSLLAARIDGLIEILGCDLTGPIAFPPNNYLPEARAGVTELLTEVQGLTSRREELKAKLASLPRYEATLRKLLPIIPPSANESGNMSVGVLVGRESVGVLDSVAKNALDLTKGQAEVVASDVDISTRAMFIVFPEEFAEEIETLLGREDVSRLRLPDELSQGPPDVALAELHHQLNTIPEEIKEINYKLDDLAGRWGDKLVVWQKALRDELDANNALSLFGETDTTFVVVGWIPAKDYEIVKTTLRDVIGDTVLMRTLPLTPAKQKLAPVKLQNPLPARPFESLVKLLAIPRYGHIDPTPLMALFLPIFFGMILGDVGYGLLLLALSLGMLTKYKAGVVRDVLIVLAMGSGWSIIFGFLYGEAFGTLGEHLGMHALWFDRASSEYVAGLLAMSLAVGAVHITLGLILGVWEGIRDRSKNHLLERGGMLLGLMSLFMLVGVMADILPEGFMSPAISGIIVGIVLIGASLGWLGILMGPIEFIGLIGNVLSYLRIAAIGLASVYLAKVANDVAGMVGNLIVGIILATLIHALNLVLGAFSPTIHSLRLHYVEFFRKFYEGGGRPYEPFKRNI